MYAPYLSEPFSLCMFLKAERREMYTISEDLGFGKDTDSSDTVNLHLHVWVAIGITQVC